MNRLLPQTNQNERGASTFQLIALIAVVLILITAAYTTIKGRSDEIDGTINYWMDNQVQLWRENTSPPPPYLGMTYRWDIPNGNVSGGNPGGGNPAPAPQPTVEPPPPSPTPPPPQPPEEECDDGFFGGVGEGIKDMLTGIWELLKLLWEILADFDSAKEKLGAMADQLKELADGLWSFVTTVWYDQDGALEDLKKVMEGIFPEIAEALERECYGEAIGRLTVEVATIAVSFTKATKLLKFLDNLTPEQLIKFFKNLTPEELLKKLDELTPEQRKALKEKLENAGAPCSILGAFANSFSADTLVMTPSGLVAISAIEIGDLVLAYHEGTGEVGTYPVTATMRHLDPEIVLLTIEQEQIETTPEHPFYVMENVMESVPPAQIGVEGWSQSKVEGWSQSKVEGWSQSKVEGWSAQEQVVEQVAGHWVGAGRLEIGDDIRRLDGSTGKVESVDIVSVDRWMYNLTVAKAHTFFVGEGEWLVHNSCNYRKTFFDANPDLAGKVVVHHAIEQSILTRYPGLFTEAELHALSNLRGIPNAVNSDLHLSKIRKEWNKFYKANPSPTKQDVIDYANQIDKKFGDQFLPPVE